MDLSGILEDPWADIQGEEKSAKKRSIKDERTAGNLPDQFQTFVCLMWCLHWQGCVELVWYSI